MIFTLNKIIILCVKYRMLHVKQPDVASGVRRPASRVPPETKPLKKVKKIIQKKVILCGCFNPLSPTRDQHQFSPNNIHAVSRD